MNDIQEHIKQLEFLLQTISEKIEPYQQSEPLTEKQNQLHAIESTIQKLQKDNTPIPDDLRDLKLKLVCEIEAWQDAEKIKKQLQSLLKEYNYLFQPAGTSPTIKKRRKRKKRKKKIGRRIEIIDLLEAGVLPKESIIFRTYKGIRYEARIDNNGKIVAIVNGKKLNFDAPSAAAKALSGLDQNGWTWWFVSIDGKKRELDHFRKEYLKHEAKRGR
jgi:hypothetical protein